MVLAAVILAMFMAAIEATIVATAMPSIVGDLGGFALFSWVFSGFLLMQAVTVPIYGKLADLFGRKPVFTFGVVLFLLGSFLSGTARTMNALILFRLIQGFGAGAVQPIASTVVGDIYTLDERAKVQGYLSGVWGISSVVGPALGGIMVTYIHWAWVFWLNIPLGILAIVGIQLFLHEDVAKKQHRVDYLGSALLLITLSSLMVALISGGTVWPWTSGQVILLVGVFFIGITLFIRQEKRAAEPMMPLGIWRNRLIAVSNLASLTTGLVMMGISTFLPTFVQGIMGYSPTVAGFTLAMMSVGWPIASALAGKFILKHGFRTIAVAGGVSLILGAVFFVTLQPAKGPAWAGIGSFIIGVGMGLATTTFIVAIQSSVDWQSRGVATASNMFMRILGNTLGASLLGSILNNRMNSYLVAQRSKLHTTLNLDFTNVLLDPAKRQGLTTEILNLVASGLTSALHDVYLVVAFFAVISLILILYLPKKEISRNQTSFT